MASFDRNGTLRNAEKLLRQGKLEAAAAEYLRVVEDQPGDWNTANTLGDLYARAGQSDRAIEQYMKVAESLRAMQRAILSLVPLPDIVLVDAFRVPDLPMAQRGVPHGDRRCSAIAAASIVAKVTRDRQMLELHGRDPRYGFDRHKGYATADHLDAVARFGYSEVHRRSFRPPTLFDTID